MGGGRRKKKNGQELITFEAGYGYMWINYTILPSFVYILPKFNKNRTI